MKEQITGQLKSLLAQKGVSLALYTRDGRIRTFSGEGIRPLLNAVITEPEIFNGAFAADKVIGKAAALLLAYGNVRGVYAGLISETAIEVFNRFGIFCEFSKSAPFIQNRLGTGQCPMENLCADISGPAEAVKILHEKIFRH